VQRHTRLYGYALIVVILGATAYPLTWPRGRDSFPLSSYPMFSRLLPTAAMTVQYAIGVDAGGGRHHLAPELVANDEVLQARAVLAHAVGRGRAGVDTLCKHIAGRVARTSSLRHVIEVRIVTGSHDAVAYLTGRDRVGSERLHGRCSINPKGDRKGDRDSDRKGDRDSDRKGDREGS
jgi:hypothetical protein